MTPTDPAGVWLSQALLAAGGLAQAYAVARDADARGVPLVGPWAVGSLLLPVLLVYLADVCRTRDRAFPPARDERAARTLAAAVLGTLAVAALSDAPVFGVSRRLLPVFAALLAFDYALVYRRAHVTLLGRLRRGL